MQTEQQKLVRKLYRERNKEKINAQQRLYKENNPEKFKEYKSRYLLKDRERAKTYNSQNKEKIKVYRASYMTTPQGRLTSVKGSAKVRGIEYKLTKDYAIKLLSSNCHYCGQIDTQIGIDRIDSDKGYITENCVSCCTKCNYMKGVNSYNDFINQCKLITWKHT